MANRLWLTLGRAGTGRAAHLVGGAIDVALALVAYRRLMRRR